jgi:tetratricopeptide (TPR) repeat protein
MKKEILIFLLLLFSVNLSAQQTSDSDSLKFAIDAYKFDDTVKVEMIYEWFISKSLNLGSSSEDYIKEALEISKNLNFEKGEADGYFYLAWFYQFHSSPELSIKYSYKAIELYKKRDDIPKLLRTYSNLSKTYNDENDSENALVLNLKTIKLSQDMPNSPTKASYYFYTSKTYSGLQDYDNALNYINKAIEISEACDFKMGVIIGKSSKAHTYTLLDQFEKALPLLYESLDFYIQTNNNVNVAATYSTLGECYFNLNEYQKAVDNLLLSSKKFEEIGDDSKLEDIYNKLGLSYESLGQFEPAITYLKKSAEVLRERKSEEQTKAIEELKTKYNNEQLKQEKLLAESNEKLAQEKEIIAIEKEKSSRYISYGLAITSLTIIFILLFIYRNLKTIRLQKSELDNAYTRLEESKKNELAVSNLKALQSQMNPHFIFNALNSVQDLVLLQDIRNSNRYLGKFSDLIRKILLSSKKQFIPLEEEVEILNLYLDLEKLRFGDEFNIDFKCDISEMNQEEIMLPAMFIQPYIENAIKHGLFHKEGVKNLKVYFDLISGYLRCIVEDNGVGQAKAEEFKVKSLHLHTGFSTEAINERIRLLNETLDRKIELKVEDLYDNDASIGTKITLLFPV